MRDVIFAIRYWWHGYGSVRDGMRAAKFLRVLARDIANIVVRASRRDDRVDAEPLARDA